MDYIDIHAHMTSRTTDDYHQLALTGCVILSEPSFWAGYDRISVDAFEDYFKHLTTFEPARAAKYGIKHYTLLGVNPKESDDRELSKKVLPLIPQYLEAPNVLGVGEIGVNRVTENELATFIDLVDLAVAHDQLIQIHTPHLEDKLKGTKAIIDILLKNKKVNPKKVIIDHVEEHTIEMVLKNGFWAGITLYPQTKVSLDRAVDIVEVYGKERILIASACDWGPSLPIAIPHFIFQMKKRGHSNDLIRSLVYENPIKFFSQSPKFKVPK